LAASFAAGEFEEALDSSERQLALADQISDADVVADIYELAIPVFCAKGRFEEARGFAQAHDKLVKPLTVHHRLHGISIQLEVEEIGAGWEAILELAERTQKAVEANLATPCVRNARSLLVTALAAAYQGEEAQARELEQRAQEVETSGYEMVLGAPRLRLALLRGELTDVDSLTPPFKGYRAQTWFALQAAAARIDALAELGERNRVEEEAPPLVEPQTYLEPFALRALGRVRRDEHLIEQAAERFDAMGLDWYAGETRALLSSRTPG
jgi:hypothetical protein